MYKIVFQKPLSEFVDCWGWQEFKVLKRSAAVHLARVLKDFYGDVRVYDSIGNFVRFWINGVRQCRKKRS